MDMGAYSPGPYLPICILILAYFFYKLHQRRREHQVRLSSIAFISLDLSFECTGRHTLWRATRLSARKSAVSCQMAVRNRRASSTIGRHCRQPSLRLSTTIHRRPRTELCYQNAGLDGLHDDRPREPRGIVVNEV